MLIIDEVKKLKQILLNNSSLKEQAFYQFLLDEPLSYPVKGNLTEIEQICLSVFGGDLSSKQKLISVQRNTQPIGRMHYTKNLIELSAMAIDDIELERKNLISYSEKCSTRDFFILNKLFPDTFSNPPQPRGAIDQIALHLSESNFPQDGWKQLLLTAVYENPDLTDFYIIEQGYLQAMDDNPIVHRTNDIIYLRDSLTQIAVKTERRVILTIRIVSVLILIPISYWLFPLIVRNWNDAEPIIAGIQLLFSLIGILFILFVGFIPDKINIINSCREKIINWVFKRKGFNRSELKETLDRLTNQDETQTITSQAPKKIKDFSDQHRQ